MKSIRWIDRQPSDRWIRWIRSIRSMRSIRSAPTRARSRGFDRDGPRLLSFPRVFSRSLLLLSRRRVSCRRRRSTVAVMDDAWVRARVRCVDGRYRWSTTCVRASCGRGKNTPHKKSIAHVRDGRGVSIMGHDSSLEGHRGVVSTAPSVGVSVSPSSGWW